MPDWEQMYRESDVESMPWFSPDLDHDLARALDQLGIRSGRALDLGAGPGTQAMGLAERGFTVTATDISATAVQKASDRARQRGLTVTFVQDDILASRLEGPFNFIFDRGCFHTLEPDRREDYVRTLFAILVPGGFLFLKCFSVREPGDYGPHRFTPEAIRALFAGPFEVHSIEETEFHGARQPNPLAVFSVMRRSPQ
ncbi:MAG TPA: class I SAM-dependent methyltransferase [Armatimonadota bacterium]|nr:class I SAM-dependent methyltransferase [Armatimonadota bacterium]